MRLKKKVVSLALAAAMMISISVPALATSAFNMSVFDGRQDVSISSDDMSGTSLVFPRLGTIEDGGTYLSFDDGSRISVSASLQLTDSLDLCFLDFSHTGSFFTGLNSVIVKIGDNRYTFSNTQLDSTIIDGIVLESFRVPVKRELTSFMDDFIEHSNDEIKIRFVGDIKNYDFVLTDDMKSRILTLYDLYAQGGGTRDSNLRSVTLIDPTIVAKNGKTIDGLAKDKAIDAAIHAVGSLF